MPVESLRPRVIFPVKIRPDVQRYKKLHVRPTSLNIPVFFINKGSINRKPAAIALKKKSKFD